MTSKLTVKNIEGLTSGAGNDTVIIRTGNADRVTVTNTAITIPGTVTNTTTFSNGLNVSTIKESIGGSNTAMTIDTTGRILTPARPAFRGTISSLGVDDYTTETTLTSYTEDFDIGGNFNPTTGIFTAPITGIYQINYFGSFNGAASATTISFKLIKNSSTEVFISQTDPQGGSQETIGASLTLSLTASDAFKLNLLSIADTSVGIKNIDFSGFLVG